MVRNSPTGRQVGTPARSGPAAAASVAHDGLEGSDREHVRIDLEQSPQTSTRDRILGVALDLFVEKGFDGTSLREIAERLGITKAALYYHFASKDDILMALHMQLHEFGRDALTRMKEERVSLELWGTLLDEVLDRMLAHRKLFLMHERNQAVLEKLHREGHDAEHEDLQDRFRQILADPVLSLRDRVRMACAFGAVFAGLFLAGDAFDDVSNLELGALLRDAIHDVLTP